MHNNKNNQLTAGVDEVGHGPLAGPVIAAAVILNPKKRIPGIRDSKKLTEKQRERLFVAIHEKALAISVGRVEVHEIDQLNIYHATLLAMERAILGLTLSPEIVLIDGRVGPKIAYPMQTIVDGDEKIRVISAASIIAKVTRDREMMELDKRYPEYQFAKHKGYSTKEHLKCLETYGPCEIHRKSFAPVGKFFNVPTGAIEITSQPE